MWRTWIVKRRVCRAAWWKDATETRSTWETLKSDSYRKSERGGGALTVFYRLWEQHHVGHLQRQLIRLLGCVRPDHLHLHGVWGERTYTNINQQREESVSFSLLVLFEYIFIWIKKHLKQEEGEGDISFSSHKVVQ